ncbi:MFS transporter [Mobilitalea sibirica]|uniref:MFS transporter n=1 Tax=Mobilitalea sibirica TaxID=1462919 RepID=A0A8J7H659_9FIRM|nr:MFS transporter [Mobilitalea sibirica]MBH1940516.1 MFS transporter [Mobilitalea sibirica]
MRNTTAKAIGFNLLMVNSFVYIAFSVYAPFLTLYYTEKGLSAGQIGILSTIGPIMAIFIQPLWAMLSDKTGKRKDVLSLVVIGSGLSLFSYYLGSGFLTFFFATILLSIFVNSIIPLSDAIVIQDAKKHNLDFAKIRLGGTIGFAVMVAAAGSYLKRNPSIQFIFGFIAFMVLLLFIRILPKDNKKERQTLKARRFAIKLPKLNGLLHIFNTRLILFILAFALLSQIGISFYFSFMGVYVSELGFDQNILGLLNSVSAFSEIPVLIFINRILKRFGAMKIIIFSCMLLGIRMLLMASGFLSLLFFAQMFHGVTFMTIYFSCAVFISEHVLPEKQSQGQSTLAIVQAGIGSVIGNVAGGYLVDYLTVKTTFQLIAILILSMTTIIMVIQILYTKKMKTKAV